MWGLLTGARCLACKELKQPGQLPEQHGPSPGGEHCLSLGVTDGWCSQDFNVEEAKVPMAEMVGGVSQGGNLVETTYRVHLPYDAKKPSAMVVELVHPAWSEYLVVGYPKPNTGPCSFSWSPMPKSAAKQ